MPFCPKCKYEYNPEVTKCPDCDEYLVNVLSVEEDETEEDINFDEWVHIAQLNSPHSASLVIEVLTSKEIPAVAMSHTGHFGQIGAMGPSTFLPMGGAITIVVPEKYIVDANFEAEIVLGEEWAQGRLIEVSEPEDEQD